MEIGSEFWLKKQNKKTDNNLQYFNFGQDNKFLFSGRVAINYVLDEIEKNRKIEIVYMPSYCCESMVMPFIKKNIKVFFYEVYYENGLKYNIDTNLKCDIFFAMNYFGYVSTNMNEYIEKFKVRNCVVIEDITHSLLSNIKYSQHTDYLVGSLRKWFSILSGGIAVNVKNKFSNQKLNKIDKIFLELKESAMRNKAEYIYSAADDIRLKQKYLELYKESNRFFASYDEKCAIDEKSLKILKQINIDEIILKRKKNTEVIYKLLKENKNIRFLITDIDIIKDCPLFVPIIVNSIEKLKKELVINKIYCPCHWEKSDLIKGKSNIYKNELSLICDQRYETNQIADYINLINKYIGE